jgi:serine/threonine protein kinase
LQGLRFVGNSIDFKKYMGPEYFEDSEKNNVKFGKEGDIWSLGVMFFEICTKEFKKPMYIECFKNENQFYKMIKEEVSKQFDEKITNLILQMLRKDPTERITIIEILKVLNDDVIVEKRNQIIMEELKDLSIVNLSNFENSPIPRYGHSMSIYLNCVFMFFH